MTLLESPARSRTGHTGHTGTADRTRRGTAWRRWMAGAASVLAIGWLASPLAVRFDSEVSVVTAPDAGLYVADFASTGIYSLHYRYGETVALTVPIRNDSPLPLRITDVELVEPTYPLLQPVHGLDAPITVAPFGRADVTLRFEYTNCKYYHERANNTFDQVRVRGTTLGRSFDQTLALAIPLMVHSQVILNCPERTFVRGDDRRL